MPFAYRAHAAGQLCGSHTKRGVQHVLGDNLQEGDRATFPLYTEAIKFINHRDGLVRAAVRTLTLSVYSIKEPAVQAFVTSKPASNYFTQLTLYLAEQCQV